jgi:hypothetical protein
MTIERLAVQYVEHPAFETPTHDAALWRYMDLPKFIALLDRGALFFAAVRTFPDRFEGSVTEAAMKRIAETGEMNPDEYRAWHRATYVNCLNLDTDESVALWRMYSSATGGVAIRTSVASLISAFEAEPGAGNAEDQVMIGKVRYLRDYRTDLMPTGNAFWPTLHKRWAYRFEQEVRLAVLPQRLVRAAQQTGAEPWLDALDPIAPPGYDIGVSPAALIEQVVVAPEAPDWVLDLVRGLCLRYDLGGVAVVRSNLDGDPI